MPSLLVTVDNRLRITGAPESFIKALKKATTHSNPEYARARSMGFAVWKIPSQYKNYQEDGPDFSVPRGVTQRLRDLAFDNGLTLRWRDKRVSAPVKWAPSRITPRDYQEAAICECVTKEQGIVQAPTGAGKTQVALDALPRLGQRSLVIVRDSNLLKQWVERAESNLGIRTRDIGIVAGGKRKVGDHLTVALQQSLYSKKFPLVEFVKHFGVVVVDEVQDAAARTVNETVDAFPARYRFGFSADHTRKDRKEFLTEDAFGDVIYSVDRGLLENSGAVVPVVVRVVPTDFQADWYLESEDRDFVRLVSAMSVDEERNQLLRRVIGELTQAEKTPALVFTHLRDHAQQLAERDLPADGIPTGLLIGSTENATQFAESKALLLSGVLKVAVGTFKAVGQGIDIPNVLAGVIATPLGNNKQFFGQVRGRICRVVKGKTAGYLYYLWDQHVFPDALKRLHAWNNGLVEQYDHRYQAWGRL